MINIDLLLNPAIDEYIKSATPAKNLLDDYENIHSELAALNAELAAKESAIERTQHKTDDPRLAQRIEEREQLTKRRDDLQKLVEAVQNVLDRLDKMDRTILYEHYIKPNHQWNQHARRELMLSKSSVHRVDKKVLETFWSTLIAS